MEYVADILIRKYSKDMLKDAEEETHSVKKVKRERAYGNSVHQYNRYSHIVYHIVVCPRCTDRSSCR